MLTFAARTRLMLWPAALALLALISTSVGPVAGGWPATVAQPEAAPKRLQ